MLLLSREVVATRRETARTEEKSPRGGRESRHLYLHSRTPLAYMPSFPLQMHSYVKCKVQMHNDWRGFFLSFMHFDKCQVHLHNGWSCSYGQVPGPFARFLQENGIVAQYSTPGEPQQNGVAERRNRTLMDMVRSMISYSTLPISLWMEALKTAIYILNRTK